MNVRLGFVVLALASSLAFADSKSRAKAQAHIERAEAAHAEGRFEEALSELTLAYALDPDPQLLFAIGQIHVKLGHCPEAITFYERFLATKPSREEAAVVRQAITTCKDAPPPPVERPKPDPPVPDPPKPEPKPAPRPVVIETTAPWYKDWVGNGLVAGGVVSTIAGAIMLRSALSARDDADREGTYQDYESAIEDARGKRTIALVFTGAGLALAGAGVLRYALGDRKESRIVAAPMQDGAMMMWNARF